MRKVQGSIPLTVKRVLLKPSVHLTCFGFPNYAHSGYPIDVRCRRKT
jgi:hypothetical protein